MSIVAFYDDLLRIALGCLKWPPSEALAADVNLVIIGYEGHMDMVRDIFGGEKPPNQLPEFGPGMLSKR